MPCRKIRGAPPYPPADRLRWYLYGYLNRVRSSRLLETEAKRNVEVIGRLGKLVPDFKTIAEFRKDNGQSLRPVGRAFTLLCRELDWFGGERIAIDGGKFKAVNRRARNFTEAKLKWLIGEIDEKIERLKTRQGKYTEYADWHQAR